MLVAGGSAAYMGERLDLKSSFFPKAVVFETSDFPYELKLELLPFSVEVAA